MTDQTGTTGGTATQVKEETGPVSTQSLESGGDKTKPFVQGTVAVSEQPGNATEIGRQEEGRHRLPADSGVAYSDGGLVRARREEYFVFIFCIHRVVLQFDVPEYSNVP